MIYFLHKTWYFPNCCDAINGKHLVCPTDSEASLTQCTLIANLFFSIVGIFVLKANYKFLFMNIGYYGNTGISPKSNLGKLISTVEFLFPEHKCVPFTDIVFLHVLIGDEALELTNTMMRPSYP